MHPENAAKSGSSIYLASSFITPVGYADDTEKLKNYTALYKMTVLFSNYGGKAGGLNSTGQSAIWSGSGEIISRFNETGEGLVIGIKENNNWRGNVILVR